MHTNASRGTSTYIEALPELTESELSLIELMKHKEVTDRFIDNYLNYSYKNFLLKCHVRDIPIYEDGNPGKYTFGVLSNIKIIFYDGKNDRS